MDFVLCQRNLRLASLSKKIQSDIHLFGKETGYFFEEKKGVSLFPRNIYSVLDLNVPLMYTF